MNVEYIIVQAGGKGTRMEALTRNKPKALVPVNNLPMIFHLFRRYPEQKFVIIGDYKYDVLERYLQAFAEVRYTLVSGSGNSGTCAGLKKALSCIPEQARFMLIWCDLILPQDHRLPGSEQNIIGLSCGFPCRWTYENHRFLEQPGGRNGVAGYFIFRDKSYLEGVPENGEFVKWLQGRDIDFEVQELYRTHEYGVYSEWAGLPKPKCRPFNRIWAEGDRIYKEAVDGQGRELAAREAAWYKKAQEKGFCNIPAIYGYEPLCMERIDGKPVYEYTDLRPSQKRGILKKIMDGLKQIHSLGQIPSDRESYYTAYVGKTFGRLEKIRGLVPFADRETVTVNGRNCRNIFWHKEEVERLVMQYVPRQFHLIHGDCTFSNIMLKRQGEESVPVFLDPRGYFGTNEFYGDAAYDWVKLYYSLYSNYDPFNLKRFRLVIGEEGVTLDINSSRWEDMEDDFFELAGDEVSRAQMKLLLAVTWLSLTTYAWEDYDSVCGAFYQGLYYLEEVLQ